MAFSLGKRTSVARSVRRLVCHGVDAALDALDDSKRPLDDAAVHDARKRLRETRVVLRLARAPLGRAVFKRENRTFRDLGRRLSSVRDSKVMLEAFDALVRDFDRRIDRDHAARVRDVLLAQRRTTRSVLRRVDTLRGLERRAKAARERTAKWQLDARGWQALAAGLERIYVDAARAMRVALNEPLDEHLHEWRKRTKDLRYALELVAFTNPERIRPCAERAHRLTDLLGDDHDLAVLRAVVLETRDTARRARKIALTTLIDERRRTLQQRAVALGRRVFAQTPEDFVNALHEDWRRAMSR